MANKIIRTTFLLRRGLSTAWEQNNPVLAYGEPGFEKDTNRLKIGNGVSDWNSLPYLDDTLIQQGYYHNGKFYADLNYTEELEAQERTIYIEKNENQLYIYNNDAYESITPPASNSRAGILKAYNTVGQHLDGTMTQKAISDELSLRAKVSVDQEEEMLVFSI